MLLPHQLLCATLKKSQFSVNHKKVHYIHFYLWHLKKKISIFLTFLISPYPEANKFLFGKVLTDQFCVPKSIQHFILLLNTKPRNSVFCGLSALCVIIG